MKKIALFAIAATSLGALATPAAAQVTGTVDITGNVAEKCSVTDPTAGSTFGATVNLGELAQADGTLKPSGDLEALFVAATGSGSLSAKVICTSATPKVSIKADPLLNSAIAPTGYANRVNYTADVNVVTTAGSVLLHDASTDAVATVTSLTNRLANSADNVSIDASGFATPAATDLLIAGSYTGQIVVTISPV